MGIRPWPPPFSCGAIRCHEVHVVFDHHESVTALGVETQDGVADGVQERAVDAGAHLVEEDDLRVDHHGAAQFEQLLLTARNLPGLVVGEVFDGEEFQDLVGLGAQRAFLVCDAAAAEPGVPQPLARLSAGDHHQVLAAGHGGEFMRNLEGAQQPLVEQFVRRQAGDVLTAHRHAARGGLEHPRHRVEQRGLARAVRADQPGNGTLLDLQRGSVHRAEPAEMDVKIFNPDHGTTPLSCGTARVHGPGLRESQAV